MANIGVNYDSLNNVKTGLSNIATDQLEEIKTLLGTAQTTINGLSEAHDNVWAGILNTIDEQLTAVGDSITAVDALATNVGAVSSNFYDAEGKIQSDVNNIDADLAEYFGLPENSGFTVSENTGAETTSGAETTGPVGPGSSGGGGAYGGTGAVTGSSAMTSSLPTKEDPKDKAEKLTQTSQEKDDTKETKTNSSGETNDNSQTDTNNGSTNETKPTNNDNTNTSRDIKESSTYQEAKENAEKAAKGTSKSVITSSSGGAAMGAAIGAASATGNNNSNNSNSSDKSSETEGVKAEALGDTVIGDDEFIDMETDIDSGTHQTAPIDVTIDKNTGTGPVPALAGVAAAGLAGVGTKVFLDRRDKDDDDEEEKETFSGDYETVGEKGKEELDSSDNIGFNPETIIEEGESSGLENEVYPSSVIEDIQASEEKTGFNAMPALAAAGLAGAGLAGMLGKKEDDEEDDEKDPQDFE